MNAKTTFAKFLFLFGILMLTMGTHAQVKMGSNPQSIGASSLLELESTSKALVIPRMTTAQLVAISAPVAGMLVYNTDSNCIAQRTSNAWKYLCTTGGNSSPLSWQVTGNSGTNSGSNFLGTTNNTSLKIKTNNLQRMVVDSTGNVGIGIANPSESLDLDGSIRLDGQLMFLYPSTSNDARLWLDQNGEFLIDQNTNNQPMVFRTNTGTLEKMRIQWNGNVGIATTTPGSKLDVRGTLRLSGATSGYVGLAPAAAAGSTTYTLPAVDGSSGQVLSTDGSGNLSWNTASNGSNSSSSNLGLLAYTHSSSPNTTVVISADELVLKNVGGSAYYATSVSVSANITVSGLNGLDAGSEAINSWYYIWSIYNGTSVNALLSISSSNPSMPSGYSYKVLIGAVRNDGSGNFQKFYQVGRTVFTTNLRDADGVAGTTSFSARSISTFVPPIAKVVIGNVGRDGQPGQFPVAVAGDANGIGSCYVGAYWASGYTPMDAYQVVGYFRVPLITPQTLYWKMTNTSSFYDLGISSWEF